MSINEKEQFLKEYFTDLNDEEICLALQQIQDSPKFKNPEPPLESSAVHARGDIAPFVVGATAGLSLLSPSSSTWSNWGQTERANVEVKVPTSKEEIGNIIRDAHANNKKVRAVGSGHSWSPIIADENVVLIRLTDHAFKNIQFIKEGDQVMVKVGAGVTTGELAYYFDNPDRREYQYMGLAADVILDTVQYGGVYLAACHGCSNREWSGNCADILQAIEYIDSQGVLIEKRKTETPTEEWQMITANFGLIGVCTSLTLLCEVKHKIIEVETTTKYEVEFFCDEGRSSAIKAELTKPEIEGVEVFWWPLNGLKLLGSVKHWDPMRDRCYARIFHDYPDQSQRPVEAWGNASDPWKTFMDKLKVLFGNVGADVIMKPPIDICDVAYAKLAMAILPKKTVTASRSAAIHYQKHIDDWIVSDVEICYKLDNDWTLLPRAMRTTVKFVEDWIRRTGMNPANVAVEFRVSRGCKSSIISPAFTDDKDAYYLWIEVLGTRNFPNWWTDFAPQMRQTWINLEPSGKPHWCKWWEAPGTPNGWADQIAKNYKDQLQPFAQYVSQKDPEKIFQTKFWTRMLNPQQ